MRTCYKARSEKYHVDPATQVHQISKIVFLAHIGVSGAKLGRLHHMKQKLLNASL